MLDYLNDKKKRFTLSDMQNIVFDDLSMIVIFSDAGIKKTNKKEGEAYKILKILFFALYKAKNKQDLISRLRVSYLYLNRNEIEELIEKVREELKEYTEEDLFKNLVDKQELEIEEEVDFEEKSEEFIEEDIEEEIKEPTQSLVNNEMETPNINVPNFRARVIEEIKKISNLIEGTVEQKKILQSEADRILSGHILRAERNEITIPKHANPSTYAGAIIHAIFEFYDEFPRLSLRRLSEIIKISRGVISKCYDRWFSNFFKPKQKPEPEPLSKELEELKKKVKEIDWDSVSDDWTISKVINNSLARTIILDPYKDCDRDSNPLYMHKGWLEKLYHGLGLTYPQISKICGISKSTIKEWRERLGIAIKEKLEYYIDVYGYKSILMPHGYKHPQMKSINSGRPNNSGRQYMREHRIVMEKFLRQNPDLEISKKYLIDGKYISIDAIIHHINHDKSDNRIENLWLYSDSAEHHLLTKSSLNNCLSVLIKLGQITFYNGEYFYDNSFDYRNKYSKREIQEITKPIEFKVPFEDIDEIREEIKEWDWSRISQNWTIDIHQQDHSYVKMRLDPYKDCDRDSNPLYMHKGWMKTILGDTRFNLKDSRLCKLCGITKAMAQYWRDKVHKIHTKYTRAGLPRLLDTDGYAWIKVPKSYENPFATELKIPFSKMKEHRYVLERILAKSSNLELKNKFLLDGKYLKPLYFVHHINLDILDNRIENLWVTDKHEKIHGELFLLTKRLMEVGFLGFKEGKYYLKEF